MRDSISVIIPAYNEENSIADAVAVSSGVLSEITNDYETIIVDDGSTDATGQIADRLAKKNRKIKVIHHKSNAGFGVTFQDGLKVASKYYITGFPADNDLLSETFKNILDGRKNDSIASSYMVSMDEREVSRTIISKFFIRVMNILFGLNLKYYNGYFICPLYLIKPLRLRSKGFTIFAEIKIRLLKKGIVIKEIPFKYKPRPHGVSKALAVKNIIQTVVFLPVLIAEIHLKPFFLKRIN